MSNQLKTEILVIAIINIFVIPKAVGQDIHFSQFYASELMLNPAATGNFRGDHRAVVNYKDQWRSVANPYTTYAAAFDMKIFSQKVSKGSLGAGLSAFSDKAGDAAMGTAQVNLMLGYRSKLSENSILSAGIQGGFTQRSINSEAMQWGNQDDGITGFDAGLPSGESYDFGNYSYGDFSGGLMWNYSSNQKTMTSNDGLKANLGVALFHLNKPKGVFYTASDERLYAKLVIHGQALIGLKNTNMAIQPKFLWLHQGPSNEILLGTMVRYTLKEESKYTGLIKETALSLGGYYRMKDAFIPAILFEMANFSIGFSYDINVSDLSAASGGKGGAEVSLRFVNPNPFVAVKTKKRSLM
ncbi:MAG TPA: type IX secretion system membrane protein PorP/SprF [Flavobacteriales bacterium]|nr:type IX secretion system membrane protein PorP/SprF [Flavobacteriales bacterium]HIO68631.1 type IX secretion system membrane protein PorP/SprF [Flavobacteriales bacterium]